MARPGRLSGDDPPLRHARAGTARLRPARPHERDDLRVRTHRAVRPAHRARARGAELRPAAPLAAATHDRVTLVRNVTDIDDKVLANATAARALVGARVPHGAGVLRRLRARSGSCRRPTSRARPRRSRRCRSSSRASSTAATPTRRRTDPATSTSTCAPGPPTASSRASPSTRWRPRGRGPARQAHPAGLRAVEGRQARASPRTRPGPRRGARAGRAGTSSARPCRVATSAKSSTSTAAGSTCASRTTRTSSPSPRRPATASRGYWVHNGLVTVDGQKMSKSLGNFTLAADVLAQHDPLVVRYALAAAHYRSSLDLTDSSWAEAEAALGRIRGFLRAGDGVWPSRAGRQYKEGCRPRSATAMDDDLGGSAGPRRAARAPSARATRRSTRASTSRAKQHVLAASGR